MTARAINTVEEQKTSLEVDNLSQEIYFIALNLNINFIGMNGPNFNTDFLHEVLEHQKELLVEIIGAGTSQVPHDDDPTSA